MARNRTRSAIGGNRTTALWRLVGLFALMVADAVLLPVAVIAAGIYMAVDVLMSLIVDKRASGNGLVMGSMKGVFMWVIHLHKWVLFGQEFPGLIPSRA